MSSWSALEQSLMSALSLPRRPVAVTFRDAAPAGQAFYTVPSDHYNCPIGSHTHGIKLPAPRAAELEQTLTLMGGIGYVRMEEVPGIPTLPKAPGAVVYAPLADTPLDPDVVLVAGRPGRLMLLLEAAGRAGVATQPGLLGRPTCMALPAALAGGT